MLIERIIDLFQKKTEIIILDDICDFSDDYVDCQGEYHAPKIIKQITNYQGIIKIWHWENEIIKEKDLYQNTRIGFKQDNQIIYLESLKEYKSYFNKLTTDIENELQNFFIYSTESSSILSKYLTILEQYVSLFETITISDKTYKIFKNFEIYYTTIEKIADETDIISTNINFNKIDNLKTQAVLAGCSQELYKFLINVIHFIQKLITSSPGKEKK